MISDYDRRLLTEAGREYILEVTSRSNYIHENLSQPDREVLYEKVMNLSYQEVIALTVTEDIRAFETSFSKFLKYSLAAIAGMVGGIAGPPITMFILYLYRKATDRCVRECFAKMKMSKERKVCRYQCQLAAARKMVNEIRSQISKCGTTKKPQQCEKKLEKELVKWSKRVQSITIKIRQAQLDLEVQRRKLADKQAKQKAQALRASYDISNLNMSLVKEEDVEPVKIDPKKEKMVRTVMYLGLWAVPVPFFNDLVNYMVKKYSFACASKCLTQKKLPKAVCYRQCAYLGSKYANDVLKKQLSKCSKSKDPVKCKRKIYSLMDDWKQREAERKIKFESSLRDALRKAKAKNAKQQGKA
jgi:hypothetical protein